MVEHISLLINRLIYLQKKFEKCAQQKKKRRKLLHNQVAPETLNLGNSKIKNTTNQ